MKLSHNSSLLFVFGICLLFLACSPKTTPKAAGDPKAIMLAQSVLDAMGGQKKWDDLKFVSWTFFGNRHLIWDKKGGKVRIEIPRDTSIYLVDLNQKTGRVIRSGKEVLDAENLKKEIDRGVSMWINDSYWLFMPFKLLDPGVNLKYLRKDTTMTGILTDVLQLTFTAVGNTPDNKYEVYIDETPLIVQWAYFKSADQTEAPRVWPMDNYKAFNGLLISSDRSDKSGPSNVRVYKSLKSEVFDSFEKFEYY